MVDMYNQYDKPDNLHLADSLCERGDTMSSSVALAKSTAGELTIGPLVETAKNYIQQAKSESTRRSYRRDWQAFEAWCRKHSVQSLPVQPQALAMYVAWLAESGRKVATIELALAAISQAHKAAGHDSPRSTAPVRAVMQGIRRVHRAAQTQKAPLLIEELRRMIKALPRDLRGQRDRALLLVGFAGGFRRSELVALNYGDVSFVGDGIEIVLRRSKTDQEGAGRKVGIPFGSDPITCPVRALKAWLTASGITKGAIFVGVDRGNKLTKYRLDGKDVARVIKRTGKAIGLDVSSRSGHSLRSGLATAAAKAGKSERAIMAQTGHRSVTMVRRYIRDANLFTENAASGIGL
jgi:integrase